MKSVTVSGTTLFHVAATQYGDATQWWRIARANGLVDPVVDAVTTLSVPDADSATEGDGVPLDE